MDRQDLRATLRRTGALRWVRLSELRARGVLSCIDGRHSSCTVGAPGGNAGELVLLLSVLEWYGGLELDEPTVRALLRAALSRPGRFYLHTDRHAASRLATAMGWTEDRSEELLRHPPVGLRDRLRAELTVPEHVGCGHLRLLLERPDEYRVRRGLVEAVIRAFFELLWEGHPDLELAVLDGEHHEQALVVFHTPEHVTEESVVPTWCPGGDAEVFVNHIPVTRWLRRDMLEKIAQALPEGCMRRIDPTEVLLEVERLGARHLDLTSTLLAPGLPRHRVRFRDGQADLADVEDDFVP